MKMSKLESLKSLLKYQVEKGIDITLMYKKTDLNGSEILSLESAVCRNKHYYYPQTKHIEEFGYNIILSQRQEVEQAQQEVEKEEEERDEKEKKIRERRAEKKRLKVVRRRELDTVFYEHWIEKIKALKALMPETENLLDGRGKERKFRTYFRHQTTLFLQEIKNLNLGGGK